MFGYLVKSVFGCSKSHIDQEGRKLDVWALCFCWTTLSLGDDWELVGRFCSVLFCKLDI